MTDVPVVTLGEGKTAVVGYGLLLARATLDKTLGRPYGGPCVLATLRNWRRSWNASMPNSAFYFDPDEGRIYPPLILYLNAHPEADSARVRVAGAGACGRRVAPFPPGTARAP